MSKPKKLHYLTISLGKRPVNNIDSILAFFGAIIKIFESKVKKYFRNNLYNYERNKFEKSANIALALNNEVK
jgi:hypothetical protein